MVENITISSRLPVWQRPALEALLFFNPQQARVHHRIVESIEGYGRPEIVESGETLRIRLSGRHDAQALFALAQGPTMVPIGAVVYVRDRVERFVVVHIVVNEAYSAKGPQADGRLLLRMLHEVRAAASVTTGVRNVEFYYADGKARTIAVPKPEGKGT